MVTFIDDRTPGLAGATAVEVDVNSGPAASYEGLRSALGALRHAGATFGDLPVRYAAEWAELFPGERPYGTGPAPKLADMALAPSERRLHRESEQVFRVLTAAGAALCHGVAELGKPLVLHGAGGTDLSSLRGFMRAVEHARTVPDVRLIMVTPTRVRRPLGERADLAAERARCLRRMGLPVEPALLTPDLGEGPAPKGHEGELYSRALDPDSSAFDRVAAALAYCRTAFFSANWEGTAVVADAALGLLAGVPDGRVPALLDAARRHDGQPDAIEFEPGVLRTAADVRGYLFKVLGIQATFRGRQDDALTCFQAMRGETEGLSAEVRAQSHLYVALTLSKRMNRVGDAVRELEEGFAAVAPRPGEPDSVRRERGWLHNLRGLTHFSRKELLSAFEHEKRALACIEGLDDASSTHLRINLLSNVSVLQEKAGKHAQAQRTWDRFKQAAGSSNSAFVKHHAYRAAGLALLTGDREAALPDLDRTLACATEFADDFHECEVRLELGGLLARDGDRAAAADHFGRARAAAGRLGDPYRAALASAGEALCLGAAPGPDVAATAALSLTHPLRAEELAARVTSGRDVLDLLPVPRTKLNRPFDLVNFQE
ncbi:hypothetical protein GCM10010517_72460 [Streptosporangium fragile]|uniref:Tetratricopeptide repeat protein n=1 Tax=Streptosporangium fragile TaxID=46186 RepID=A0ABP6IR66_9ACTN